MNEGMRVCVSLCFHGNVILAFVRVCFSTDSFLVQQGMERTDTLPKQTFFKTR